MPWDLNQIQVHSRMIDQHFNSRLSFFWFISEGLFLMELGDPKWYLGGIQSSCVQSQSLFAVLVLQAQTLFNDK